MNAAVRYVLRHHVTGLYYTDRLTGDWSEEAADARLFSRPSTARLVRRGRPGVFGWDEVEVLKVRVVVAEDVE